MFEIENGSDVGQDLAVALAPDQDQGIGEEKIDLGLDPGIAQATEMIGIDLTTIKEIKAMIEALVLVIEMNIQ